MKKINELFVSKLKVLNIGLKDFNGNILNSGGESINVNWTPPADGDPELLEIIRKIKESSAAGQ
ncbi:hypothetical protein KAR04_06510 [Candidatus Calescamantes bacterium]|nr:hypothetical protein [Candidatus Calescamantes bacterium]MCK5399561.1 hypothetical protein [bacterium]MCK5599674.1 hypothetical protein [bacterium]